MQRSKDKYVQLIKIYEVEIIKYDASWDKTNGVLFTGFFQKVFNLGTLYLLHTGLLTLIWWKQGEQYIYISLWTLQWVAEC